MKKNWRLESRTMGTFLKLVVISEKDPKQVLVSLQEKLNDFEKRFSRFLSTSEMSKLNTQKKLKVSDQFLEVLKVSKSFSISFS